MSAMPRCRPKTSSGKEVRDHDGHGEVIMIANGNGNAAITQSRKRMLQLPEELLACYCCSCPTECMLHFPQGQIAPDRDASLSWNINPHSRAVTM